MTDETSEAMRIRDELEETIGNLEMQGACAVVARFCGRHYDATTGLVVRTSQYTILCQDGLLDCRYAMSDADIALAGEELNDFLAAEWPLAEMSQMLPAATLGWQIGDVVLEWDADTTFQYPTRAHDPRLSAEQAAAIDAHLGLTDSLPIIHGIDAEPTWCEFAVTHIRDIAGTRTAGVMVYFDADGNVTIEPQG